MAGPEWQTLSNAFTREISDLNAVAENARKSAPDRINAIERRMGIQQVLSYPAVFTGWADEYLRETSGRSLADYLEKVKTEKCDEKE